MFFDLIRVRQYYKNLLVFLILIFAEQVLNFGSFWLIFFGFISLCLISSTNYILNDIFDIELDKKHPEKKKRPLPSGKISVFWAGFISGLFAVVSLVIAWCLSEYFFYLIIGFFLFTQLYSLVLKNILFLDVIAIAINFVVRAIAGVFILGVILSPWLVVCTFFLSLFLAIGKRKGDFMLLGKEAYKHKKVLKYYTKDLLDKFLVIVVSLLLVSYAFYSFLSTYSMLITLPIVMYSVLRYWYLIEINSEIVRSPDLVYKDLGMVVSVVIWILLAIFLIYIYPVLS